MVIMGIYTGAATRASDAFVIKFLSALQHIFLAGFPLSSKWE
jgi:hypothetical protein